MVMHKLIGGGRVQKSFTRTDPVEFALKLRIYRSLKSLICLK